MKKKDKDNYLNDIEYTTLWMAIRYAMNRQTIASATLPGLIIENYYHRLSDFMRIQILKDLQDNYKEYGKFGNIDIDNLPWLKLMKSLDIDNMKTLKLTDGNEYKCFYVEFNDRYYPLNEYISNPHREVFVAVESIVKEVK